MASGDFKDLTRRITSDIILRDKAFNIAKNPRYDGYQRGLASMVYKFKIKNEVKNVNVSNKMLAEVLNKPVIRKFNERIVHSSFIDTI